MRMTMMTAAVASSSFSKFYSKSQEDQEDEELCMCVCMHIHDDGDGKKFWRRKTWMEGWEQEYDEKGISVVVFNGNPTMHVNKRGDGAYMTPCV